VSKVEVLTLLQELFRTAVVTRTVPDDPSGLSTTYLVDQEQLMRNLEDALDKARAEQLAEKYR
jgi:hypothetical protein